MVRSLAVAVVLSCFAASAWAQTQLGAGTASTSTSASKTVTKKPTPKSSADNKPPATENGTCGLGVIVAIGEEFAVQRVGVLFGNEHTEVPIDNWGLKDLVFARVRAAATPGIAIRRIAYSKEAFPPPEEPKSFLFRDRKAELIDLVRQITSGTNCERYVLVSRSISAFSTTGQRVGGIGIVNWANPLKNQTYLFALSYIRVFDGRNLTIVKQGSAFAETESLVSRMIVGTLIRGPHRELNEASFPGKPSEAAHNLALRDGVRALLTASLDKTLPAMLRR
jgi:hypothetical protein